MSVIEVVAENLSSFFTARSHLVLFTWSLVCFGFGVLSAVVLHYYFLHLAIQRADKLLADLALQTRRIGDKLPPIGCPPERGDA